MYDNNFGIVKAIVGFTVSSEFINESSVTDSKKLMTDFFNVVTKSPVLIAEQSILESIENKFIKTDSEAVRYLDRNIEQFKHFTKSEMTEARTKLQPFLNEDLIKNLSDRKKNLYESLSSLLYESTDDGIPNIDVLHESFEEVLQGCT